MSEIGRLIGALMLLLAMCIPQTPASGETVEWPGGRGPRRDGKSPDRGLLKAWPDEGPELLWKVDGIGKGFSSVAVSGGLIYITGDLNDRLVLFTFDLDGKPPWKTDVDAAWTKNHPGSRSTPVIDNGNHSSGWVCLDLKTGEKMWQERGVRKGSVCFADGMLYLFGERKGAAGIATCSSQGLEMKGTFNVQGDGPSWAYPVVTAGRLYLRYDNNLYCFDVKAKKL